jgi:hypothetical protein
MSTKRNTSVALRGIFGKNEDIMMGDDLFSIVVVLVLVLWNPHAIKQLMCRIKLKRIVLRIFVVVGIFSECVFAFSSYQVHDKNFTFEVLLLVELLTIF